MRMEVLGGTAMDKKIVSISSKRQITIPKKFFATLGFTNEAVCFVRGNELVLRPIHRYEGVEFAEQILADLIAQGLSDDQLLEQFKEKQLQVQYAVASMIADASNVAQGIGEYVTYDELKKDLEG